MSDLLPLVVATLKDKVAVDAQKEIDGLQRRVNLSHAVEVIQSIDDNSQSEDEDVIIYASGQFQDGKYAYNPNLWEVGLKRGTTAPTCPLSELNRCCICVGGGFPVASLDDQLPNRPIFDGFFDPDDEFDGDNSKNISFCFCPNTIWLNVVIQGWPRSSWEAVIQANNIDPGECIQFLVQTVAVEYPEATAEFKSVSFVARNIHGALKRLLPQKRKIEVRTERDGRDTDTAYNELYEFVIFAMRENGNENNSAIFIQQSREIMSLLGSMNIHELNENNEGQINALVRAYERVGREEVQRVIQEIFEIQDDAEAMVEDS